MTACIASGMNCAFFFSADLENVMPPIVTRDNRMAPNTMLNPTIMVVSEFMPNAPLDAEQVMPGV